MLLAEVLEASALPEPFKLVRGPRWWGKGWAVGWDLGTPAEKGLGGRCWRPGAPRTIFHPVLAGGEASRAELPVAGVQGPVPATWAPGGQLGSRGTCLDPAGGLWPGAAGGCPRGELEAGGPGLHMCTVRLPGPAVQAEPALLAGVRCGESHLSSCRSCAIQSPAQPSGHSPQAQELGEVNKWVAQRQRGH